MTLKELQQQLKDTYEDCCDFDEHDWMYFFEVINYDKKQNDYDTIYRDLHPLVLCENKGFGMKVQVVKIEKTAWEQIMEKLKAQTKLKDIKFMFVEAGAEENATELKIKSNSDLWVYFEPIDKELK